MRKIRIVVTAFFLAALAVIMPLKATTAWAFPVSGAPSVSMLEQMNGTSSLITDVSARRYYPRYRHGGSGYSNHGYRNYGHQYHGYRNYGHQYHGYRNSGYRHYGYRDRYYGRYNWRHYGHRYAYRYPGYNYFNGGFWYASPWWSLGYANDYNDYYDDSYDAGYDGGYGGGSHVEWCLNRYRSYNPRTNTFMGYDGRRHYCRSPY